MASTRRARPTRGQEQSVFSLKPAALAVAVALSLGGTAYAQLPTGAHTMTGVLPSGINTVGNTMTVTTNANRSIVNWQTFSIGSGAKVDIQQLGASSAILNRVTGVNGKIDPSSILGTLQSNGRVFLINPSGIVFGAGAQVDVAGLVASTLRLSDTDFLANRLRFTDGAGAGSVVNDARPTTDYPNAGINAREGGNVYLVGASVTNNGLITTPKGEVVLAAGNSVELVSAGTPNLRVEITAPGNEARNLGDIVAEAGRVGIYAGLINHSGTIRVDGAVAMEDGRIILKATKDVNLGAGSVTTANGPTGGRIEINAGDTALVAGTVEAKGTSGQGGVVHVLGDKVGIYGNARVDASGETGGGTVLAGGEFRGQPGVTAVEGAAIRNATATFFGADAAIAADAIASGDGGKVVLWSDHTTHSYGTMSARGGAVSGNGGLVETSGKISLDVTRGPDVRAPNGLGGTWLIDPNELIVDFGSGLVNNSAQPQFFTLGESSVVGVDLINLQLDGGSNVLLTTTSAGADPGTQQGNITIRAPIIKRASTTPALTIGTTTLTVQAHNNIIIEGSGGIAATQNVGPLGTAVDADPLNVILQAAFTGSGTGGVTLGGTGIATKGGSVNISGRGPIAVNAPINTIRNTGTTTSAGSVSLNSTIAPVTVAASIAGGSFSASAGGAGSLLTLAAPVNTIGNFTSASLVADDMEILAPLVTGSGGISVQTATANRPMSLGGGAGLSLTQAELSNLITTGPVQFFSSGAATVSAPVTLGSSSVSISSNNSFTVSPGASLTTSTPLFVSAPATTINGGISAQRVQFSTSTMAVNAPVNSTGDIDIFTSNNVFLGNGAGGGLDLDSSELGLLVNGAANRLLVSGGAMTVQGAVSRVGQGTFLLSGNTLGQAAGATITADDLRLSFSTVTLPEANNIGTLTGFASTLNLSNASLLTVGSASAGLSTSAATLKVDDLNVANTFSGNTITIMPLTPGRRINLGGTAVGGELNISATDLANIFGTTVALNADLVDIRGPVSTSSSNLIIAPVTSIPINVVAGPGKAAAGALEFLPSELNQVTTSNTFTLGDPSVTGAITVSAPVSFPPAGPGSVGTFALQTGNASGITVGAGNTVAANNISLTADAITLGAAINAVANISVAQNSNIPIVVNGGAAGPALVLSAGTMSQLNAPGTLSIGNSTTPSMSVGAMTTPGSLSLTAGDMTIAGAVTAGGDINVAPVAGGSVTLGGAPGGLNLSDVELDLFAPGSGVLRIGDLSSTGNIQINGAISPANATNAFSLLANGSISQTAGSTITVPNLRVMSNSSSVNLANANNSVGTLAGGTGFSSFAFTGTGALTIGTVDGAFGISGGSATIKSDTLAITSGIFTSSTTLAPRSAAGPGPINLGAPGGQFGLTDPELDLISSFDLTFGDTGSGPVTVNSAMTRSSGTMNIVTGSTVTINDVLTGPSGVSVSGGSITTGPGGVVTSSFGNVSLTADAMVFGGGAGSVSAPFGTISVQPIGALTDVNIGGADAVSTTNTLGLDNTDIAALSAPNIAINGKGNVPIGSSIGVTAATNFGSQNVTLATQTGGTINVAAGVTTTGDLSLLSDTFAIGGTLSGANVLLRVLDSSRSVDLGTAGSGSFLLDSPELSSISTPGTFTLSAGTINVPTAVGFMGAANVALKFNTSAIAGTVTSNGRLTVAARDNFTFDLTTAGLTTAAIGNLRTSGVLQIGDFSTGALNITQSIVPDSGVSALALVTTSSISQTAGKTITAPNLRIQTSSATLNESNSVGNLAGSASTLNFTTAGALNIGAVDGATGLSGSTIDLRSDTITVSNPISGFNVTLAPRQATAPIDVGSKPAGVYGVSDAEIDMISADTLSIGTASHTGVLNVTAPVDRASGTFNLAMAPAGTINVNAAFASPNGNVGLSGGTVNINAPLTAQNSITVTGDNVQIAAPLGSSSSTRLSSATVQPISTGRPISVGTEVSGAMSLTAAELALINSNFLTIGSNNSGALAINAPVAFATLDQLTLRSGSSITQSPGAPILLQKVSATGQRVGNLSAFAGTGGVDLRAAGNEVPEFVQGSAGTGQNFLFSNSLPTKLQNISASAGGKVLVNSGLFGPLPPPLPEEGGGVDFNFQAQLLAAIDKLADINDALDETDAEGKKKAEDEKKKQRECGA